jgi:hypothetical protein
MEVLKKTTRNLFLGSDSNTELPSSSKHEVLSKGNDEFGITKDLCSYFEGLFNML